MRIVSLAVLLFALVALIEAGTVYNRPIRSPQLSGSSANANSQSNAQGGRFGLGGGSSSSSANAESSSFGGGFGGGSGSSSSASASAQTQSSSKGALGGIGGRPAIGIGGGRAGVGGGHPGVGLGPAVVGRPGGFGPGPVHYSGPIRPVNPGFGARPSFGPSSATANAQAVSVGK